MSEKHEKPRGIDPPMCKVCEHRHWFGTPHVFGKSSTPPKAKALAAAKAAVEKPPLTKRKDGKVRKP